MRNHDHHRIACEDCGETAAVLGEGNLEFQYGIGADEVTLVARVPMWSCEACGTEWTGDGAERMQNQAICAHLGRLSAAEIKEARLTAGLTQAQFAERLQVGEASVKRWELGATVPNRSSNKLLLDFRAEHGGVRAGTPSTIPVRRFRTDAPSRHLEGARAFDFTSPFPPAVALAA